jgi:hypothetical protein
MEEPTDGLCLLQLAFRTWTTAGRSCHNLMENLVSGTLGVHYALVFGAR